MDLEENLTCLLHRVEQVIFAIGNGFIRVAHLDVKLVEALNRLIYSVQVLLSLDLVISHQDHNLIDQVKRCIHLL